MTSAVLRILSFPISFLYLACIQIRLGLYSCKLLRSKLLSKPVISIGNLSMGGTGKTPAIIAVGGWLSEAGLRVSVLSRGYKGIRRGGPLLVSDGCKLLASADLAGDEPLVIAKNLPGVLVSVGKNRWAAGRLAETLHRVDVHLLDDGFQHLRVVRNFNLLLIDVSNPWGGGLPPLGRRREPLSAMRRADAVLLTRCRKDEEYKEIRSVIDLHRPGVPIFHSQQTLDKLVQCPKGETVPLKHVAEKKVLALSGIGNPAQFHDMLVQGGLLVAGRMDFPDHHYFLDSDYQKILSKCRNLEIDGIVTTEKDLERLNPSRLESISLWIAGLKFTIEEQEEFFQLLRMQISSSIHAQF